MWFLLARLRIRLGRYCVELFLVWDMYWERCCFYWLFRSCPGNCWFKIRGPKQFYDAIWHNLDPDLSELVWNNCLLDLRWARIWYCPRRFCTAKWHHHQLAQWERARARGRSNINALRNLCWYYQLFNQRLWKRVQSFWQKQVPWVYNLFQNVGKFSYSLVFLIIDPQCLVLKVKIFLILQMQLRQRGLINLNIKEK